MDFTDVLNELGKIAGTLKFEPVWKPYDGVKPVWIACEGLTEKDAKLGLKWIESLMAALEEPYQIIEAWEVETPGDWEALTSKAREDGLNLVTLGAPDFRYAYHGTPIPDEYSEPMEGFYKVICYASNFSHIVAPEDDAHTEAELVKIRKKQKRMLWQNRGDFDLQLTLELTKGLALDFAEA